MTTEYIEVLVNSTRSEIFYKKDYTYYDYSNIYQNAEDGLKQIRNMIPWWWKFICGKKKVLVQEIDRLIKCYSYLSKKFRELM